MVGRFFSFFVTFCKCKNVCKGLYVGGGPVREQQQPGVPRLAPRPNETAAHYSRHCVHSHTEFALVQKSEVCHTQIEQGEIGPEENVIQHGMR